MTKRNTKAIKTTKSAKTSKPRVAKKSTQSTTPDIELAAPETVVRHEVLGVCDFLLVDPGDRMPAQARQALFELQKGKAVICVMQCAGYVFNVSAIPYVTFMDREGNVTGSSVPESDLQRAPNSAKGTQ